MAASTTQCHDIWKKLEDEILYPFVKNLSVDTDEARIIAHLANIQQQFEGLAKGPAKEEILRDLIKASEFAVTV